MSKASGFDPCQCGTCVECIALRKSKACGCKIHVVFHDDHLEKPRVMNQWIEQCPLHASAGEMLKHLKLWHFDHQGKCGLLTAKKPSDCITCELISRAEGKES